MHDNILYISNSLAAAQGDKDAVKNRDNTAKQLSEAQGLAAQIQYKIEMPGAY